MSEFGADSVVSGVPTLPYRLATLPITANASRGFAFLRTFTKDSELRIKPDARKHVEAFTRSGGGWVTATILGSECTFAP